MCARSVVADFYVVRFAEGTVAEFLDETGVSFQGWTATNDSPMLDTRVGLTVKVRA